MSELNLKFDYPITICDDDIEDKDKQFVQNWIDEQEDFCWKIEGGDWFGDMCIKFDDRYNDNINSALSQLKALLTVFATVHIGVSDIITYIDSNGDTGVIRIRGTTIEHKGYKADGDKIDETIIK